MLYRFDYRSFRKLYFFERIITTMITTTPWNEYYNNIIIYVRTPAPHLIDINVSGMEKRKKNIKNRTRWRDNNAMHGNRQKCLCSSDETLIVRRTSLSSRPWDIISPSTLS